MPEEANPFDKYLVDLPEGKNPFDKYIVPPPEAEGTRIAKDVGKQFGVGVAKSIPYLYGMPGDLQDLVYSGIEKAGGPPANMISGLMGRYPTSTEIEKNMTERYPESVGARPEPKTPYGPYAEKVGEFTLPAAIGPGSAARKALQYTLAPGVASEAGRQAFEGTSYETPAAIGGAMVAPGLARRLASPLPATPARINSVRTLQNEGIEPSAGQQTGSHGMRYAESMLSDVMFAPERAQTIRERPMQQFTRAVLRRAGINAEGATPDVIDAAYRRLGGEFNRLAANNHMVGDRQLFDDLFSNPTATNPQGGAVTAYFNRVAPEMQSPAVRNAVDSISTMLQRNGGHLTGEQYQTLRSYLSDESRSILRRPSNSQDAALGRALSDVAEAMDDAMERTMRFRNPDDAAAWSTARRQYRALMPITQAAAGGGEVAADGILSPARMRQAIVGHEGSRAYARGRGDFAELVRAGNSVLTPLPNSGTAQREHVAQVVGALTGALTGIPTYLMAGPEHAVSTSVIGSAAGHALGPVAGMPLASRVLFSDPAQYWLTRQWAPRLPNPGDEALAARLRTGRALMEGVKPKQGQPAPQQ